MRCGRPKKEIFPILFLLILTLAAFYRPLFTGENYLPADLLQYVYPWRAEFREQPHYQNFAGTDVLQSFYPSMTVFRRSLEHREVPMWNPGQSSGVPFAANCVNGVFYPLNTLLLLLFTPEKTMGLLAALHVFLSGFFMYLLLRYFRARRFPALAGAIVFMFAGPYVVWRQFPPFNSAVPWIPLILLLYEVSLRNRRLSAALLSGAAAGVQLLAGNLQNASFSFIILGFYAVYRFFVELKEGRGIARALFPAAALATVVAAAFAVASVQLVPTLELFNNSNRTPERFVFSHFGRVLPKGWLGTVFIPDMFGNPAMRESFFSPGDFVENCVYVGLLPVSLFFVSLFAIRDRKTLFFQGLAALMFLFLTGTPVYYLYYYFAPGAKVVSAVRFSCAYAFAMAVGTGLALNYLATRGREALSGAGAVRFRMACITATVAAAASIFISLFFLMEEKGMPARIMLNYEAGKLILFAAIMILVWILLFSYRRMSVKAFGAAAVALIVLDLFAWGFSFNPSTEKKYLFPATGAITYLQSDHSVYRIRTSKQPVVLPPNSASVFGLQDVSVYDSLYLYRYYQIFLQLERRGGNPDFDKFIILQTNGADAPILDYLNIKYYLSATPVNSPDWELVNTGDMLVYRSRRTLPRVMQFTAWKVGSESEVLNGVVSNSFEPSREVYLEEAPRFGAPREAGRAANAAPEIASYSPGYYRIKTLAAGSKILTVSENYYPGWKAWVDGKQQNVMRANYAFMGLPLAGGTHDVELRYTPDWARRTPAVSLAAALLCIAGGLLSVFRRKK